MPPLASVLWAAVAIFQLCLAAPAILQPTPIGSTMPPRDLDGANSPVSASGLVPVSEVFKMMSEMSKASLYMTSSTPIVSSVPMLASTSTSSVNIQSTGQPTTVRPVAEPSLVVYPPPMSGPELAPPHNTSGQPVDHDGHRPAPIHKLIVIGFVIGGIMLVTLCLFILLNRHGSKCRREKKTVQTAKISPFYDARKGDESGYSTDSLVNPVWPKFPPPSATHQPKDKQPGLLVPPNHRVISGIMDITSGFPDSRFSITSSEYTHSLRASTTSNASMPPLPIIEQAPPPLLPPSEFFSLPSSPDIRRSLSSGHSRNRSAPIFGHNVSFRGFLTGATGRLRAGDHRKSKSISGLVYDVGRPGSVSASSHRRSTASKFSQYKGTPPTNGFLSASDQ
jgi:hypothetical protein